MGSKQIGIDVGGTFTDLFMIDKESADIYSTKTWSHPTNQDIGFMEAVKKTGVDLKHISFLSHGCTVAVNAVVTRTGAKTGMICTKGHRDILDQGTGFRPFETLYDLSWTRPHLLRPIIPRQLRREVEERILYNGSVLLPLNKDQVLQQTRFLIDQGVDSIAIMFINSYLNPDHEKSAKEVIQSAHPDLHVFASSEIYPLIREVYRCSTVALNAYISPKMSHYLGNIETDLKKKGFEAEIFLMQGNGGFVDSNHARERLVYSMNSGPVAGVIGARFWGELIGEPSLLTFDMGGTTTDVSTITQGVFDTTMNFQVETDLFVCLPMIEVDSIGAGGGSIAWVDAGGALHVGPQAAGATPGPACYGHGGVDPTVTDAHMIKGTLFPGTFFEGREKPSHNHAEAAVEKVAKSLNWDIQETAQGIFEIVNTNMVSLLRGISIYKGRDPRDYSLLAYGAAGPMHASVLGRELGVKEVIIPPWPGEFSAMGLLVSDFKYDCGQSYVKLIDEVSPEELGALYLGLEEQAVEQILAQGISKEKIGLFRSFDGVYMGQSWDTPAPVPQGVFNFEMIMKMKQNFEAAYQRLWGYTLEYPIQISTVRVSAVGYTGKPEFKKIPPGDEVPLKEARIDEVEAYFRIDQTMKAMRTPVFDRSRLLAQNQITGPAIIAQPTSTTILLPNDAAVIDIFGNIRIRIQKEGFVR